MNEIEELKLAFVAYKYRIGKLKDCVDWAVERLVRDEDEGDADGVSFHREVCLYYCAL